MLARSQRSVPGTQMKVALLHGLFRRPRSMKKLATALRADGHAVFNLGYPSTQLTYAHLVRDVARSLRESSLDGSDGPVAFVCHSMGGLIWRDLGAELPGITGGPAVLLGTPLLGSIVARTIGDGPLVRLVLGPAIAELAIERDDTDTPYPGPFATVAGTKWTPVLPSAHILRRVVGRAPSDSTVLVSEVRSSRAVDHLEVHAAHTLLPATPGAIEFVRSFIRSYAEEHASF